MDEIVTLIERQIHEQTSQKLSDFMMRVSSDFKIPVKLLLRYLEEPSVDGKVSVCCMGIKKDGTRCSIAPKVNGYCGFHKTQGKDLHKLVVISDSPKQVHIAPPSPKNGVIDMSLIRM